MTTGQAISDVARVAAEPTEAASDAVTVFTADLYREIADDAQGDPHPAADPVPAEGGNRFCRSD
jgi:hypothetical protein